MLCYDEILGERQNGRIFIEPFHVSAVGANSVDVSLGNWFIPLLGYKNRKPVYGQFFWLDDNEYVNIPRDAVLLAMTKERIGSTGDIAPQIMTRSSIERSGIDVCKSAGLGDIGYFDQHWTVELTSHIPAGSAEPACLVVGRPFAQVIFHRSGVTSSKRYSGQYQIKAWPLCMLPKESRADHASDKEIIKRVHHL